MAEFIIDCLAVARLSRLVREDTILDRPRTLLLLRYRKGWLPKFLRCEWCVPVWAALLIALLRRLMPRWYEPVGRALAASYVASQAALHLENAD